MEEDHFNFKFSIVSLVCYGCLAEGRDKAQLLARVTNDVAVWWLLRSAGCDGQLSDDSA